MFSCTAEYALRAAAYLAQHTGRMASSHAIAAATKVPQGYLSKILKAMVDAGLVKSHRGPNGGFSLAMPSARVSVLDVINAVDPMKRILTCPLGIHSHGSRLCTLHRRLDDATVMVERVLSRSSIAEMVFDSLPPPCGNPACRSPDHRDCAGPPGSVIQVAPPGG